MDNKEPEKIKRLELDYVDVVIRETYIDENGHENERERIIKMPYFYDVDIVAKEIGKEIGMLNVETEFTLQYYMEKFKISERDKFEVCTLVLKYCYENNIIILEKNTGEDLNQPWNIVRIKKN